MGNFLDLAGNIITSIMYALPALPLAVSIAVVYKMIKGRQARGFYTLGIVAFVLYMYAMLDLTLISRVMALLRSPEQQIVRTISPITLDGMVTMATTHYENVNYSVFARNVFGNIIMFVPLGLFIPPIFT